MSQLDPIVNQPNLYMNGLILSNDATTPNTKLDVAAGVCRDSNNIVDINLGNYLGLSGIGTANSASVINFAVNGANGLDTGSIAASTFYYIYAIADSSNKKAPAALASTSASAPVLPFGYDSLRLIGCCLTDGSSHILKMYCAGNSLNRYFQWDAPISVLSGGTSTTYAAIDLSGAVPSSNFGRVWLYSAYTPNTAGNNAKFQPQGATGDWHVQTGNVATKISDQQFGILPLIASAKPEVAYKVTNGSDALSVSVEAFEMVL